MNFNKIRTIIKLLLRGRSIMIGNNLYNLLTLAYAEEEVKSQLYWSKLIEICAKDLIDNQFSDAIYAQVVGLFSEKVSRYYLYKNHQIPNSILHIYKSIQPDVEKFAVRDDKILRDLETARGLIAIPIWGNGGCN